MNFPIENKICSLQEAEVICKDWQNTVFTNGCFDLIHKGHISYLRDAARLGSHLIVGINSDDSVKRLEKGSERPLKDEDSRAFIMAAFSFVSLVIIFNEDTPYNLVSSLKPTTLVKGGDYDPKCNNPKDPKYIVGKDIVSSYKGNIQVIPFIKGHSTTQIVNKIKKT